MWKFVFILGLVGAVLGDTTPVNTCNNRAPQPLHTYVLGCTAPPCGLPQSSTAVINLVFESPRLIRALEARATAYLAILPIPYGLDDQADACRSLTNSYCPVQAGEILMYQLNFFIEDWFPVGISVNVEFDIVDVDTNQSVACIRLPIRVDPPLDTRVANTTLV